MKNTHDQHLPSRQCNRAARPLCFQFVSLFLSLFLALLFSVITNTASSAELTIHAADPPPRDETTVTRPDQLPHSRVAHGTRNIVAAWLAGPTDRYRHGVLGDELEASQLVVETSDGESLQFDLPVNRVFEDLEPRLADLTEDNHDDILVVESDSQLGASLAVYGIVDGRLAKVAATPFLGQPNRWLNPVGVGDFDGDGRIDVALVATPHIGGILRLYTLSEEKLALFAEYPGVSTHRIGSTELGLGRVVSAKPRDRLLVPNQARRALMLLEWTDKGWQELTQLTLPGVLDSSLISIDIGRWRFRLDDGKYYDIQF